MLEENRPGGCSHAGGEHARWVFPCWRRTGQVGMGPVLDQVRRRPEGQARAHLKCPCVPVDRKLAGVGEASHANCAVVGRRTLAAAVDWWWQSMAKWMKSQGPQWRHKCAQIKLRLFVCVCCHVACR